MKLSGKEKELIRSTIKFLPPEIKRQLKADYSFWRHFIVDILNPKILKYREDMKRDWYKEPSMWLSSRNSAL